MQPRLIFALLAVGAAIHPGLLAQVSGRAGNQQPRRPRGIYAVVAIEDDIKQEKKMPQLDIYFAGLYWELLTNPAASGLALQVAGTEWRSLSLWACSR